MNDQLRGSDPTPAESQASAEDAAETYCAPKLTRFGTLVDLTLSGSNPGVEQSRFTASRLPPAVS